MNLCRCENGHFYDKEKYPTCPHCGGGAPSDDSLTSVFTEELGSTAPVSGSSDPFPVAGMSANDATIPSDDFFGDKTMPLGGNDDIFGSSVTTPVAPMSFDNTDAEDDDDDHTVGFFDDDFFGAPTPTPAAPVQPARKAPIDKLDSPCVGWLIALNGAHLGTDFRLKVGKNFVGRSPQMDVALTEDKSVSRDRHTVVVYEPKKHMYFVQPGEASSLVYKNDEVVLTPMLLEAYDIITVGDINLLFIPLCGARFSWTDVFEALKK